ncbi:hypothetical protein B5F86_02650 [Lachnoclostridium sp. An298]|nr:hypothetical protein B5F86_02650 [Lachnoclostridium sp. An298]
MKESIKVRLKQLQRISGRIFRSRLLVLMGVFCLTSSMLVCRCFYLQIIKGEEYAEEYELRIKKTEEIKATRGNIYDRNGNLLAYNELAYSITIEDPTSSDSPVSERNETINAILEQVLEIVEENGDSVINSFGITLDSSGNCQFSQTNETQRLRFVADVYGYSSADDLTDEQKNQTADDIIEYLCTDEIYGYGLDYSGSDPGYILDMVNMRYAMHLNSYQKYMSTTIATGVSRETAAAVMENKDVLTGVDIAEDSVRKYTDSEVFSSIIGYTGQISEEEYSALSDEMQDYMDYVCDTVLTENTGILDSGAVDYSDDTYTEWSQGNISLYAYLNYAISRNWINTVNLSGSSYSSSAEIYQAILDYVEEYIESDSGLTVLLYMADGTQLGFVGNVDLYTMFGNALDNAVESVVKQEDVQKRVIQVSVFHKKNLQMIRVRNYCDEKPVFSDGLPVSTKKDRRYHGYGLKSIRYTAEKYGGGIVCQAADNYFVLQILLPIPESVRE